METNSTSSQDRDREQPRWELLLILLVLLASVCCIFSSTELALGFWPQQVQASLLPTKQADYTGGPGVPYFAVFAPRFGGEAATDIARLQITPTGDAREWLEPIPSAPDPEPLATPARPTPLLQTPTGVASTTPAATVNSTPTEIAASTPTAGPTTQASPTPAGTPILKLPTATAPPATSISSPPPPRPSNTPLPNDDDDDDDDDGGDPLPKPTPTSPSTATPTNTPTPTATPTNTPAPVLISGRIFEVADYSGGGGTAFGGGDAGLPNVTVELYDGSTLLASTTTNGIGVYNFTALPPNGTYLVRAVSATIGDPDTRPAAGFKGGFTSALAEQTYESDGLTGNGGAGALGGNDPRLADTATAIGAGPGDTNVTVTTVASDVTGVDLGFAFNLVANTTAASQGSLRQAIANANAINGTMNQAILEYETRTTL